MITSVPAVNSTDKYPIGLAAEKLQMHRNTLRKYVTSGLIRCGYRRENHRRFITGGEILRFWKSQL